VTGHSHMFQQSTKHSTVIFTVADLFHTDSSPTAKDLDFFTRESAAYA
jgi:hypothetical protein